MKNTKSTTSKDIKLYSKIEKSLTNLDNDSNIVAAKILNETDVDKVKDLTTLFNLNNQKRNVIRVLKMNNLLDKVTENIIERIDKTPDNFSNDELIKYLQVTEDAIDKANKNLNLVEETPSIQLLQDNSVNITMEEKIDRESRNKIIQAIQDLLDESKNQSIDVNFEEIESKKEDNIKND